MNKSAALSVPAQLPGQNAPDLGFQLQLLPSLPVQGHILSIVHQGLGTSMERHRPFPAVQGPSGHDPLCGRGPLPFSTLPPTWGPSAGPSLGSRIPPPPPSLPPASPSPLEGSPSILATTLPSPASPRPYLLHPSQSPPGEPQPRLRLHLSLRKGWDAWRAAAGTGAAGVGGRSPAPGAASLLVSGGGGARAGPRAQSAGAGGWAPTALAGGALGGSPLPGLSGNTA